MIFIPQGVLVCITGWCKRAVVVPVPSSCHHHAVVLAIMLVLRLQLYWCSMLVAACVQRLLTFMRLAVVCRRVLVP